MGEQPLTLDELSEQLHILGYDDQTTQEILGITQAP